MQNEDIIFWEIKQKVSLKQQQICRWGMTNCFPFELSFFFKFFLIKQFIDEYYKRKKQNKNEVILLLKYIYLDLRISRHLHWKTRLKYWWITFFFSFFFFLQCDQKVQYKLLSYSSGWKQSRKLFFSKMN